MTPQEPNPTATSTDLRSVIGTRFALRPDTWVLLPTGLARTEPLLHAPVASTPATPPGGMIRR